MINIIVAGIGGIGGFYGGYLAKRYGSSGEVRINFFARGENEIVIRANGLRVESGKSSFLSFPNKVTNHAKEFGIADYVICCTKTYGLQQCLEELKPCISVQTILLPLLNGVDSVEKIKMMFPENEVWEGCVYLVSRLVQSGIVKESGNINQFYFGSEEGSQSKLHAFEQLLKSAEIPAHYKINIQDVIWEKFVFISAIAATTSYLNKTIGQILGDPESLRIFNSLLDELLSLADVKKVSLPEHIKTSVFKKMSSMPFDATSSMHTDFQKGKQTEIDSLCGYVVKQGNDLGIDLPFYNLVYNTLKEEKRTFIN